MELKLDCIWCWWFLAESSYLFLFIASFYSLRFVFFACLFIQLLVFCWSCIECNNSKAHLQMIQMKAKQDKKMRKKRFQLKYDGDEWCNAVGKLVMDSWCFAAGFDDASTTFELFRFYHTPTPTCTETETETDIHRTHKHAHTYIYLSICKRIFWINRKNLLCPAILVIILRLSK